MVWGLKLASSFGGDFPDGDHVGWENRDRRFQNTVGGETYSYSVPDKFVGEIGRAQSPNFLPIAPIADDEWPVEFATTKRYTSLGSLIKTADRLLAVDEPLKAIIERLEQGVHQFRPLVITMPKNEVFPRRFYTMVIDRFLDSFQPEKSVEGSWRSKGADRYSAFIEEKNCFGGLALSQSVFGGCHIWRERKLGSPDIFLSDALQTEIKSAGLSIPQHFRLKEVA